jgi:hypothetical protein
MGLNTQFPSWVSQMPIAQQEVGQQMGRNILEGLRFQEQKRQAAEEQRRYDALAPMRTAQMELMRARTTQEILDAEKQREALNIENRFNANQVEALRFQEGIARSEGNYSSPENEASFYRFLSKNPDFTRTEWAKKMQENFKLGRENAFKAEQLEKSLTTKVDVAEIRGQPKVTEAKRTLMVPGKGPVYGTQSDLEKLAERDPDVKKALETGSFGPKITQKQTEYGTEVTKTWPAGTPQEVIDDWEMSGASGIQPPPPGAPRNTTTNAPGGGFQLNGYTIRAK